MKKSIYFLLVIPIGIFIAILSCEPESNETCQQDVICEAKEVTACCTGDVCVYKYNEKEYSEDEVDQLAIDLGCTNVKSTEQANDLASIIERLRALLKKAQN